MNSGTPGHLPDGWTSTAIGEVCELVAGVGFPKHLQGVRDADIPVFKVGDISQAWQRGQIRLNESPNNLTAVVARSLSTKLIPASTVVFAKIGAAIALNRRAITGRPCLVDNNVMGLVPREGLDSLYLFYFTCTVNLQEYARATTVPSIRKGDVASVSLPLPPRSEQSRLVEAVESYLTRLDAAVASIARVHAKLKAYRTSVLKAAVEGRLVPTEASVAGAEKRNYEPADALLARILEERRRRWEEAEIAKLKAARKTLKDDKWKAKYNEPVALDTGTNPQLPGGWCWASVDQLTDGARNSGYGVLVPGPDVTDGVPLVRVGDIHDGTVSTGELKRIDRVISDQFAKTYLSGGEVLLSLVGTIGRSAVVPHSLSGANVARAVGVIPTSSLVRSRWVEIWFRSPRVQALMNSRAHEVARKTLNLEDVRAAAVAVPPVTEQDRIIAETEDLESIAAAIASTVLANSVRCSRLRQAVLRWAFDGKLVDQDPSDEPAEKLLDHIRAERAIVAPTKRGRGRAAKGAA